jgi:hypothetical protein
MTATRLKQHMNASRADVYRALLDAAAVATWMVPNGMTGYVHSFNADPEMRGEMTVTYMLVDADGGTDVLAVHDNLPPGLSPTHNETGWRMALAKLARFVEKGAKQ